MTYLEVICFVEMGAEGTEQLWVPGDGQVFHVVDSIHDGLPGGLLHLNVVELTKVAEPLDELGSNAAIELVR